MKKTFLVIGERCLDYFTYGRVERLSPEAPVPVFTPFLEHQNWGMAQNVYENLKSLLDSEIKTSVNVKSIFSKHFATKRRFIEHKSNHSFLRVDTQDNEYERIELSQGRAANKNKSLIKSADYILISDYNKGFLLPEDFKSIRDLNKKAIILVDTKKILSDNICRSVNFIKLNKSEYSNNLNSSNGRVHKYKMKLIVTLGEAGAIYRGKEYPLKNVHKTVDVSGAGDTFLASLAYAYSISNNMSYSINFANVCASRVVGQRGVAVI